MRNVPGALGVPAVPLVEMDGREVQGRWKKLGLEGRSVRLGLRSGKIKLAKTRSVQVNSSIY